MTMRRAIWFLFFLSALFIGAGAFASVNPEASIEKITKFTVEPIPTTSDEERAEYIVPVALETLKGRLYPLGMVTDTETHYPMKMLRVGRPYQTGNVFYFSYLRDATYSWMLEEWVWSDRPEGRSVTYWEFFEDRIRYRTLSSTDNGSPTHYIVRTHHRWEEAVEKSKWTLKMLCEGYGGCSPEEFAP